MKLPHPRTTSSSYFAAVLCAASAAFCFGVSPSASAASPAEAAKKPVAAPSSTSDAASPAEASLRSFDLPAGDASTTLRLFATQSGEQVLFLVDEVRGVRTRALAGRMRAADALRSLLAGTVLRADRDPSANAWVVTREARAPSGAERRDAAAAGALRRDSLLASASEDGVTVLDPFVVSEEDNVGYSATSTLSGTRINTALRDVGAAITVITPEFLSDTASTDIGELLSLTTSTEVGGTSGNFAGGTTFDSRPDQSEARENPMGNQRVRGIGAATTSRDYFITDIPFDAYNISRVTMSRGPNSLLFGIGNPAGIIEYSLNKPLLRKDRTEVSARYGSKDSFRGTLDVNRVLVRDRLALRVSTLTQKNNFAQEPAFDRSRRAYLSLEAVLRKGDGTGMLGRTTLRSSAEFGRMNSLPVNVIPPTDGYSPFFEVLDPALDDLPGVEMRAAVKQGSSGFIWRPRVTIDNRIGTSAIPQSAGGYYGVPYFVNVPLVYAASGQQLPGYGAGAGAGLSDLAGVMGRIRYTAAANKRNQVDFFSTRSAYVALAGFTTPSLQDRTIFDYRNRLLSGDSNRTEMKFSAANAALAQELFRGRGGLEVAVDQQKSNSSRSLPFSHSRNGAGNGQSDIYIDVSQYLSNDQPNPNVGRPFIQQAGLSDREQWRDREALRGTGFYRLDLENEGRSLFGVPLGNHTLTGMYSHQQSDYKVISSNIGWVSDRYDLYTDVFQENLSAQGLRRPVIVKYVGPSVLNAASKADLRITDVWDGRIPQDGDRYKVTFFDNTTKRLVTDYLDVHRFLANGGFTRQRVASESLSLKSDFWKNHIVSVIGWRWDNMRSYANTPVRRLADTSLDPTSVTVSDAPNLDESGRRFTWSLVGRYPQALLGRLPLGSELSAYFNTSGNFNPVSVRTNLLGEIIPAPAGKTKEWGVLLEMFERRVSLRLNWFQTNQTNSSNNAGGATSEVYTFPNFLLSRYVAAEKTGIPFNTIAGVTAAGYSSYQQLYDVFLKLLPERVRQLQNLRIEGGATMYDPLQGLTDVSNLDAKGFEAELVGNLTRRWRMSLNVAKQETIVNGSARLTKQVADELYANLVKYRLLAIEQGPGIAGGYSSVSSRYLSNIGSSLAATVARDGAVSQEQRRWRANLVTSYDLADIGLPVLKRMTVGTAVRWQAKIAIGNPFLTGDRLKQKIVDANVGYKSTSEILDTDPIMQSQYPDLENPFWGPEELTGDFWIGYKQRLTKKIDWRLQLNVRNAWGNSKDIPVTANPDGTIAIVRIPNETRWYLSSTFTF